MSYLVCRSSRQVDGRLRFAALNSTIRLAGGWPPVASKNDESRGRGSLHCKHACSFHGAKKFIAPNRVRVARAHCGRRRFQPRMARMKRISAKRFSHSCDSFDSWFPALVTAEGRATCLRPSSYQSCSHRSLRAGSGELPVRFATPAYNRQTPVVDSMPQVGRHACVPGVTRTARSFGRRRRHPAGWGGISSTRCRPENRGCDRWGSPR